MTARYVVGDVFDGLATLESDSVDLVLTSPPFLALRSYLPAGHPDKAREIGSEATPAAFIDRMLDVVEACSRVLAPHGSLVVELGDTYSGSGVGGDSPGKGDYARRHYEDASRFGIKRAGDCWPLDKSLCMVPQLFAASLAYGHNLLNPQRETAPWRIRNWITWGRPKPPVGALGDKVRPASSWFVVACKGRDRWFDLDAVRTEHVNPRPQQTNGDKNAGRQNGQGHGFTERTVHPVGAPPLDWWDDEYPSMLVTQATEPYVGAHYATWPETVAKRFVDMMCPRRVCRVCGQPSRRIVDTARPVGWSDCGHDHWRRGRVLDPFAGTGTTLAVAEGCGLDSVGIDLDARNVQLAAQRVGLFLETSSPNAENVAVTGDVL